jgi:hypothetical protein
VLLLLPGTLMVLGFQLYVELLEPQVEVAPTLETAPIVTTANDSIPKANVFKIPRAFLLFIARGFLRSKFLNIRCKPRDFDSPWHI